MQNLSRRVQLQLSHVGRASELLPVSNLEHHRPLFWCYNLQLIDCIPYPIPRDHAKLYWGRSWLSGQTGITR